MKSAPPQRFSVEGLCCASEARQIEAKLTSHPGVSSLHVDPVSHTLLVQGGVPAADVERAIADLGMRARRLDAVRPARSWWDRHGRPVLAFASGVLLGGTLLAQHVLGSVTIGALLAVAAVVAGGWYVFPRGYRGALNRALDMNFLMSVAAIGALLIGEYAEAASVMFLFAVAQLLEAHSVDRARNAIRSLMELSPVEASVLRDGREVRIAADAVRVGEIVVVRPGEKIPVDGAVVSGRSSVHQAPITGESVPVAKEAEDGVFAGTLNGEGALEVRSTKPAADTTLARIIHSVEEAQATRAPSQTFVDRFARIYTPVVVASAIALALLPPALGFGDWGDWFYRALALLVVACPCALVISTPVTVVSALAGGARRGILIKGGLHLENAGRARVIALDKTGTLTEGRPAVVSIVALNGASASQVLAVAAAAEARSEHPLAAAILRYAQEQGAAVPGGVATRAIAGRGIEAWVDGRRVVVGSERLITELGREDAATVAAVRELETAGNSVMLVAESNGAGTDSDDALRIIGAIAVADRVRPAAGAALRELHEAGMQRVVMLTGDNAATAAAIAGSLNGELDDVLAGLLPDDKVDAIRQLKSRYGTVLMVGDGINDAPALAAADVGIAMGAAGTDVALETADIALMADDLTKLPVLIRLARKAERIIRTNIAFALALKAVFVVLAVAGVATLWMAVLADMGASLLVIGNGLRALRIRLAKDSKEISMWSWCAAP
jgi:Cd2+/Zn2+-exporting ATPase